MIRPSFFVASPCAGGHRPRWCPPPSRLPARSVRGRAPLALAHPPPVVIVCTGGDLAATGGGILFFFSQGGRGPPWESPFSRGKASLHEGAALRWRASCAGLRFRDRRSWTVPTGHQDPSRQVRRCRLQAAEGVFRGKERAGKSKKSPSLWGRGKGGGALSPGGAGGPCRARR